MSRTPQPLSTQLPPSIIPCDPLQLGPGVQHDATRFGQVLLSIRFDFDSYTQQSTGRRYVRIRLSSPHAPGFSDLWWLYNTAPTDSAARTVPSGAAHSITPPFEVKSPTPLTDNGQLIDSMTIDEAQVLPFTVGVECYRTRNPKLRWALFTIGWRGNVGAGPSGIYADTWARIDNVP